jgi:hypothetical protein
MNHGIYTVTNDKVLEETTALFNSIRFFDAAVPIIAIPYDESCKKVKKALEGKYNIGIFKDTQLLKRLNKNIAGIFGKKFFDKPNKLRKLVSWFGPFDEFLYLDADIIAFEKIIDNLKYLSDYDFISCDYQYKRGIKDIFTQKILDDGALEEKDMEGVFNSGFWGSKKGIISEEDLYKTLEECASHPEYFDFSQKVTDMPVINYLALKNIKKRCNIARDLGEKGAGSWAGMKHFKRKGNVLIDANVDDKPLKYLHWAGIKIKTGCPYYDIWDYYRHSA